jgi:hypothetical protein
MSGILSCAQESWMKLIHNIDDLHYRQGQLHFHLSSLTFHPSSNQNDVDHVNQRSSSLLSWILLKLLCPYLPKTKRRHYSLCVPRLSQHWSKTRLCVTWYITFYNKVTYRILCHILFLVITLCSWFYLTSLIVLFFFLLFWIVEMFQTRKRGWQRVEVRDEEEGQHWPKYRGVVQKRRPHSTNTILHFFWIWRNRLPWDWTWLTSLSRTFPRHHSRSVA